MKLALDLSGEQMAELAQAVVSEYKIQGLAVVEPVRMVPYKAAEAAEALGVSVRAVHRWIESGHLRRVPGTSKVLIVAGDVQRMQEGGAL